VWQLIDAGFDASQLMDAGFAPMNGQWHLRSRIL